MTYLLHRTQQLHDSICPGKDLAEESVRGSVLSFRRLTHILHQIYIAIATILATLDVQKAIDVNGQPITPSGKYRTGLLWYG
jgi:hypothetical protein